MDNDDSEAIAPLTREDIEALLSQLVDTAQLDLQARNMRQIDLSYLDLQGANLRGSDLRGANLRGINLRGAQLQQADLREADLDGADLSGAQMGESEAQRARLAPSKLSYATLGELNLRGFDLTDVNFYHADLRGADLRGAILHGADLRGADLSTALLNGPELHGALLYRGAFFRARDRQGQWGDSPAPTIEATAADLLEEYAQSLPEQDTSQRRLPFSEREAYLYGMNVLLEGVEAERVRQLFPQGFSFARTQQLFDTWLAQAGIDYNEQEIHAIWIGFAHRICDLYFQNEDDNTFYPPFTLL